MVRRDELLSDLRKGILCGRLGAGQPVPTESELMSQYQLTRHGVRTALSSLVTEGLISRTPGRGSIVCENAQRAKTRLITFMVNNPREWLAGGVVRGLSDALSAARCRLELVASGNTQEEFDEVIEDMASHPRDGVVIVPLPWLRNQQWVFRFHEAGMPFVCVDTYPPGLEVDSVTADNHLGGYLAGRHLIDCGYRRLYFFSGRPLASSTLQRYEGFTQAVVEAGTQIDCCIPLLYDLTDAAQRERRQPWLTAQARWKQFTHIIRRSGPRSAVFAGNDIEAYGVCLGCREVGLEVGRDIAVIGFDDRDLAVLADPPLTTVSQDMEKIGTEAAKVLLKRLDGQENGQAEQIRVKTHLVERRSVRRIDAGGAK